MENILIKLIKHRLLIIFLFLLIIIAGIVSFLNIPIDAFPDLTNNQVMILTDTKGMPPVQTEELVTIPIESVMNGLPKVEEVRSVSKLGLSVVTVVFKDNINIYFARQLVNERLQTVKARIPADFTPEMGPITTGMGEILQYTIEGMGYDLSELKTLNDWDIKYQLRTIPGVNEVNNWGGKTLEYQVVLNSQNMMQYGVTLREIFEALKANNETFSGGIINHHSEQYIVTGVGFVKKLEDIGNITVKYQNGVPIQIKNIAKVEYGSAIRQGAITKNGEGETVIGIVMMLKGENSAKVIKRTKEKLEQIKQNLPEGVFLKPFYDQTTLVKNTIHTVQKNLLEGGMFVIAVLLFMLGNLRAALIVAITIPIAMMFSITGMNALGISASIMSLGAIDFGMIVDGAIVMAENIIRNLANTPNRSKEQTFGIIQSCVKEMAKPIFFGVLIITIVYVPILFLEGMEYKMFSPMVFAVCFALFGSLLVALLLVPVLASFFLNGKVEEKRNILIEKIKRPYLKFLLSAMKNKEKTLSIAAATFVLAIGSLGLMGSEFVPKLDEGSYVVTLKQLPSISLQEAIKTSTEVENILKTIPEVKTVVSRIGRPDLATDPAGVYITDVFVILKEKKNWRWGMTKNKIIAQSEKLLKANITGTSFSFTQPIEMRVNELVSGVKSDVALKIFGKDIDVLIKKGEQVKEIIENIPGHADVQLEQLWGANQITILPDREKMARYGVDINDFQNIVATAIRGQVVSEIIDGKKRFALKVIFPEGTDTNPDFVGELLIENSQGHRIPISQVATVQIGNGIETVNRESGERRIIIETNVRGRDMGSFVKEAQGKINKQVKLPKGYHYEWGGQFKNQQRAMKRLSIIIPISILIIFLLLYANFSSLEYSLLVILNVPFACVGGIIALWLRGMYLSVPAFIGFIALWGVAILDGLVLLSQFNKLLESGMSRRQAVLTGVKRRLRPVLMTASVASLGFLPMALSNGAGAEVQKPLATVVIGGLATSTLLTLVVLPMLYYKLDEIKAEIASLPQKILAKIIKN